MDVIGHLLSTLISLIFLAILGTISGVAVPGLFLAVVAPWLDWIAPVRED
jgi:hypothetical protein